MSDGAPGRRAFGAAAGAAAFAVALSGGVRVDAVRAAAAPPAARVVSAAPAPSPVAASAAPSAAGPSASAAPAAAASARAASPAAAAPGAPTPGAASEPGDAYAVARLTIAVAAAAPLAAQATRAIDAGAPDVAIDEDAVYLAEPKAVLPGRRALTALRRGDLAELWTAPRGVGAPMLAAGRADGGGVYATSGDSLVSLDPKLGTVRWRAQISPGFGAIRLAIRGASLFAIAPDGIAAFDPATGAVRWRRIRDGLTGELSPAIGDTMLLGSAPPGRDPQVLAADIGSGVLRWQLEGAYGAGTPASIAVVRTGRDGGAYVVAVDARTGFQRSVRSIVPVRPLDSSAPPPEVALRDDRAYVGEGGDVYRVPLRPGGPPAQRLASLGRLLGADGAGGLVVANGDAVFAVDWSGDGARAVREATGAADPAGVLASGATVVVRTNAGDVAAFGAGGSGAASPVAHGCVSATAATLGATLAVACALAGGGTSVVIGAVTP